MRIIEGEYVDLIDPFPKKEVHRVYGWMHCYRTMTESDITPKGPDEFDRYFNALLDVVVSYGVIDKQNLTNSRHEAPLIGLITFEPHTIWNGFVHVASSRKAWGKGLMDEAGKLVLKDLFTNLETLQRLSAWIFKNNIPAQHYVIRAGFRKEGVLRDFIVQDGLPKTIYQYGLTRRDYATSSTANSTGGPGPGEQLIEGDGRLWEGADNPIDQHPDIQPTSDIGVRESTESA